MNAELQRLAQGLDLDASMNERLRLSFGHACAQRVRHFLEDPQVLACLDGLTQWLRGAIERGRLDELAATAAHLAQHHGGSRSLDGCGHAAVSASHAVAHALAGHALQAADYAAYAAVYGEGGYGAVTEGSAFEPEHAWQCRQLQALSAARI